MNKPQTGRANEAHHYRVSNPGVTGNETPGFRVCGSATTCNLAVSSAIEACRTIPGVKRLLQVGANVAKRIDKASRLINAPPSKIYEAFATPDALETWLPPQGMTGRVLAHDFRKGGLYRMRLSYDELEHTPGKTSEHSDEVEVRFVRLVPNERIEQTVTFNT